MKTTTPLNAIGRGLNAVRAGHRYSTLLPRLNGSCSRSYTILNKPRASPQLALCQSFRLFVPCRKASTSSSDTAPLERTSLYGLHVYHGAKMVPFAGYSMPVQYSDLSVGDSHKWTREKASLFDVGHMVQHHLSGPSSPALLELMTPTAISALAPNHSTLSCLLHPGTGGIVDDTVITRLPSPASSPSFYIVTNAACRAKDLAYLSSQIASLDPSAHLTHTVLASQDLIALQGPLSASILSSILSPDAPSLQTLYFGQCASFPLQLANGALSPPCLVSRGGYTGEDGFEISIPPEHTTSITENLMRKNPETLRLAGLGARDSLRLEAGMCLYGHDLDDSTTPVEAGLAWIVPKARRTSGGFHGAEAILPQLKTKKDGGTGVARRRVGLVIDGAPAREGAEIVSDGGEPLGTVTSGCPSPSLGTNIAMGYVRSGWHKAGTEVGVLVRGKRRAARVVRMPFVETRYVREGGGTAPG